MTRAHRAVEVAGRTFANDQPMVLIGGINGGLIAYLRLPAFMVTLTSMMFFSGLAIWSTQSKSIYGLPDGILLFGQNAWLASAVALVVLISAHLLLKHTLMGRWIYAVGHNQQAATISGVPVQRVILVVYILSGLCAGTYTVQVTDGDWNQSASLKIEAGKSSDIIIRQQPSSKNQ